MSALTTLNKRLLRETFMLRKGAAVTEKQVGNVHVTEVWGYPATPDEGTEAHAILTSYGDLVDVHFVNIGFHETATDPQGFGADLEAACNAPGEFYNVTFDELKGGPSYITLGAWLGSQDMALRLIGLGKHYGYWDVITPAALGLTGELATEAAGRGLVMNAGYRQP